jgi:CRP/FNR family cyclic AMP-dependent transcriptional regulator
MGETDLTRQLQAVPLFSGVPEKELRRVAKSFRPRTFAAGQTIVVEGNEGVGFFIIDSGTATVSVGGEEVRKLGEGDHFGEIALIDSGPRSATVVADTDVRCHGMTAWSFRPLVESNAAIAWPLLESLVRRLRDAEQRAV